MCGSLTRCTLCLVPAGEDLQEAFFDDHFKSLKQFKAHFTCSSCNSSKRSGINSRVEIGKCDW